jgi:hypothetical protein
MDEKRRRRIWELAHDLAENAAVPAEQVNEEQVLSTLHLLNEQAILLLAELTYG